MIKKWIVLSFIFAALVSLAVASAQAGPPVRQPSAPEATPGTTFTYQGRLNLDSQLVNNACDLQFRLYDDALGNVQIGATQTITGVAVSSGLFTVQLDFGAGAFQGDARWLGVWVQCQGDAAYTGLGLQALTATPYALALPGLWTQQNATSPNLIGGYSGNGVGDGVVGATIGGGGASDDPHQALGDYVTIGGGRANIASGNSATVAGGFLNTASGGRAAIGGGLGNTASGESTTVGGGASNASGNNYSTVGGGYSNTASGNSATVAGGVDNTASGNRATIGGGYGNTASGTGAFIGGGGYDGSYDGNQALGDASTIGGGLGNVVTSTASYATIGGGLSNTASGDSATIGGGDGNTASGDSATVGGGDGNTTSGWAATIGGGVDNTASNWHATVGGGHSNIASGIGATIGGGGYDGIKYDGNEALGTASTIGGGVGNVVTSTVYYATIGGGHSNTASGGAATVGGGEHNTVSGAYATVPGGYDNAAGGAYSFAAGRRAQANHDGAIVLADSNNFDFASLAANTFKVRATGGIRFVLGINGSGDPTWSCLVQDGSSWSCSSDRNLKENLNLVDGAQILRRLAELPVYTWNGQGQDPALRHMGPMAQDFYAAFGLGEDDTHIATIDLDGVALAAIQRLATENATLREHVSDLEMRLSALEASDPTVSPAQAGLLSGAGWLLVGAGLVWVVRRRGGGR